MNEKPILFSGPMVRALLAGIKTQTRRLVKYNNMLGEPAEWCSSVAEPGWIHICGDFRRFCPYGQPGGRLWVRETWRSMGKCNKGTDVVFYRADGHVDGPWRPSIFMPRWASRITLEITEVRVQRLQEISEADARAEGAKHMPDHRWHFREIWDSINGKKYPWASNPWVWCLTFKRVDTAPGV